jgi:hypothetical protein
MPNFTDYMRLSQNLLGGDDKTKNEDIYKQAVLLLEMNNHFPEKYREMSSASDSEKPSRLSERTSNMGHSDQSDDLKNFQGLMSELSNNGVNKIYFEDSDSEKMKYMMLRFFTFSKFGTIKGKPSKRFLHHQRECLKVAIDLKESGRLNLLKESKRYQSIRRLCHLKTVTEEDIREQKKLLDSILETEVVNGKVSPKYGRKHYDEVSTAWNKRKGNPQSVKKIKDKIPNSASLIRAQAKDLDASHTEIRRLTKQLDIISDKAVNLERALDLSHAESKKLKSKVKKLQDALGSGFSYALKLMSELKEAKLDTV